MAERKWTPGPWEWDAGDAGQESSHPYCQVYVDGGDLIIADVNDLFDREVGHANAHLIAAAPELYEALAGLVGMSEGAEGASFSERMEAATAALAKAEGAKP